jgi:protein CpxP
MVDGKKIRGRRDDMKTPLLALSLSVLLGIGTTAALAQPQDEQNGQQQQHNGRNHGRWGDPQQRVNMLAKRLNLTDDQKQKLLPILTDEQQQMQAIHQDSSQSRDDRMAKMKSLRQQTDDKINGILNDDQKTKYAEMQQHTRERMQQHQGGGGNQSNQ